MLRKVKLYRYRVGKSDLPPPVVTKAMVDAAVRRKRASMVEGAIRVPTPWRAYMDDLIIEEGRRLGILSGLRFRKRRKHEKYGEDVLSFDPKKEAKRRRMLAIRKGKAPASVQSFARWTPYGKPKPEPDCGWAYDGSGVPRYTDSGLPVEGY